MTTLFALLAGALALGVFATVLWPLRRQSPRVLLAASVLLALAGFALYRIVGTPAALQPQQAAAAPAAPRDLDEAIAQLRQALATHPEQTEGWLLLGRALASAGQAEQARDAFARAAALAPDQPEVLVAAAQARMLARKDQTLDADAVALLEHALALRPDHQRARWFLGVAQRQAGQPAQAAQTWQPLLAQVDAATRASLVEQINLARQDAGQPPLDAALAAPPGAQGAGLTVKVALDPALAAQLPADASVFVIARIPGGPPMPVAAEKHALSDLPLTVTLDDGDSPMPTQKLSALAKVEVLARLSRSGNALPQPGDISSAPVTVTLPASQPVELVLGAAAR